MALTVEGQPAEEKKRAFDRWLGRERQRLEQQYRRDFERLQRKGPQPKTGLRA